MSRLIDGDELLTAFPIDDEPTVTKSCVRMTIQYMPTIEPMRKRGKWIEDAKTFYETVNKKGGGVNEDTPYFTDNIACSECLALFSVIDNETERFDFCPNCGADMREGGEDE